MSISRRFGVVLLSVSVSVLLAMGDGTGGEPAAEGGGPGVARLAARASNAFACDLYGELSQQEGSLLLSPFSLYVALSMVYEGARGDTARQMAEALHVDEAGEGIHEALARLTAELTGTEEHPGPTAVANGLWLQEGFDVRDRYIEALSSHYGSALRRADFHGRTAQALASINEWVGEHTAGRIRQLLGGADLSPETQLVLVNAVHFRSEWYRAFSAASTRPGGFWLDGERTIAVQMMWQTEEFRCGRGSRADMLELPYADGRAAMYILLPHRGVAVAEVEDSLSPVNLADAIATLRAVSVDVALPRFEFRKRMHLSSQLQRLGMFDLFDPAEANLRGIANWPRLWVDLVIQQADITVDEQGTEAAAATAVTARGFGGGMGPARPRFIVDRPFLFFIVHKPTGALLFMGRVTDPSGSGGGPAPQG